MERSFRTLIAASIRAPSGDNTQPWRFAVDQESQCVVFHVNESRDPSPMNSGQRMARIAVGAALENLLRTARYNGWQIELETGLAPALAMARVGGLGTKDGAIDPVVSARVTNRRMYEARAIAAETLGALEHETPTLDSVRTAWIINRERLPELAALVGRADAVMFGVRSMRRAFRSKIRFDAPATAEVDEGLSVASLELAGADRIALRMMSWIPDWMFKFGGGLRAFAKHAQQLVQSAAGLCVVVAPNDAPETDLLVGRAMERAWLALTAQGLAVQPMMSLPVLDSAVCWGSAELLASLDRENIGALRNKFCALAPETSGQRPAALLRFGYAAPPSGRTGRLPLESVAEDIRGSIGAEHHPDPVNIGTSDVQ